MIISQSIGIVHETMLATTTLTAGYQEFSVTDAPASFSRPLPNVLHVIRSVRFGMNLGGAELLDSSDTIDSDEQTPTFSISLEQGDPLVHRVPLSLHNPTVDGLSIPFVPRAGDRLVLRGGGKFNAATLSKSIVRLIVMVEMARYHTDNAARNFLVGATLGEDGRLYRGNA